ncbi:MAG: hemerythrin domain-containing protein [Asticcacaulis sp.]
MSLKVPEIEPMPRALIHEPLNWLFAEHYRHRQVCLLMEFLAQATVTHSESMETLITFLREEMPLHLIDEEEDLFPVLRRRLEADDDLERVLGIIREDHNSHAGRTSELERLLVQCRDQSSPPAFIPDAKAALIDYAREERRHIALENAVILPIARLRLTKPDLEGLSHRLAARRGWVLEEVPVGLSD